MNCAILIDNLLIIILFSSSLLLQAIPSKEFAGAIYEDSCAERVLLFVLWPLYAEVELLEAILFCVLFSFLWFKVYAFFQLEL